MVSHVKDELIDQQAPACGFVARGRVAVLTIIPRYLSSSILFPVLVYSKNIFSLGLVRCPALLCRHDQKLALCPP